MLLNLILTALCAVAGVMLFEKWGVDDYMNTHRIWSKFWTNDPCLLCRGFWFGCAVFALLSLIPATVYVFVPFAAIPAQVWLYGVMPKKQ